MMTRWRLPRPVICPNGVSSSRRSPAPSARHHRRRPGHVPAPRLAPPRNSATWQRAATGILSSRNGAAPSSNGWSRTGIPSARGSRWPGCFPREPISRASGGTPGRSGARRRRAGAPAARGARYPGRALPRRAPEGTQQPGEGASRQMAMTEQEILAGLGEIIDEIAGVPADEVTPEKSFVDDLDIDSLSMVEIAVAAQDKFGVEIPDDQLKDLKTVQDVINYVHKHAGQAA